ncbi:MAG: MFS transporter [Chloroflexota bacterium]|nr:MFS transporter [Chloroflexota bacterium]
MSADTNLTASRPSGWFFTRISLFWVGLSFMWGAVNIQILPAVVPEMVGTDLQGTAIGAIVFVGLAIAIVVQPLAGAVSDRAQFRVGRRRPFMLAGVLLVLPFLVVIGLTPYYWLLFLAVVGVQVGGNIAHGPYQGVIPDQVPPPARGRASGFFGVANLIGTMLGAAIAGQLLAEGQVFLALLTIAIVLVAMSLMTWFFVRESPPPPPETHGPVWDEVRRRVRELRGKQAFVWLMGSRLLFFMGLQSMDNFLQLFFRQGLGDDSPEGKTTIVLGTVLILAVLTSVPAGWASDRFGRLRLVAAGSCLGLGSAVLLVFAQDFMQVVAFATLLGVGLGLFTAADWAAAIDLVPDVRAAGLYMGLTNVATAGGDALATLSAGVALDVVNQIAPGYGFRAVFALMGIYFLLSVIVLAKVRAHVHAGPDSRVLAPESNDVNEQPSSTPAAR